MSNSVQTPANLVTAAYTPAVRAKAAQLREVLIRKTRDDLDSWMRAVEDEFARGDGQLPNGTLSFRQEVAKFRERIPQSFDWVTATFEAFLTPDPDDLNPTIEMLGNLLTTFGGEPDSTRNYGGSNPALVRLSSVQAEMTSSWTGDFTDTFVDRFLNPLDTVISNQQHLMRLVRDQHICCKILYIRRRQSVLNLLDKSINAADKLIQGSAGKDVAKWATIAAIAVGTVAGAVTGGWGLVAAVALDAGGTIAQGLISEDKDQPELELGGRTATEVATNTMNAISRLDRDTYTDEDKATKAFNAISAYIEQQRRPTLQSNVSGPFSLGTPPLAYATPEQLIRDLIPKD